MKEELIDLAKETRRVLLSMEDHADKLMSLELFKELDTYFHNEEEDE